MKTDDPPAEVHREDDLVSQCVANAVRDEQAGTYDAEQRLTCETLIETVETDGQVGLLDLVEEGCDRKGEDAAWL